MRGAGVSKQADKTGAVLVLKGPRFRVTTNAVRMRFKRVPIGAVENARIETHKAHWPDPNPVVCWIALICIYCAFLGLISMLWGLVLLMCGSLELRLAPTAFAVADFQGKPIRLLKCANEGEAKLVVLAIREAQRIAQGGEILDG